MVDPGRVRRLLDRLSQETDQLREFGTSPSSELRGDRVRLAAIKYGFVVAIETCIDIAQHIIASEGLRSPESFAQAFRVVAEAGFLPTDLVESLEAMARFRNLLVHGYLEVDDLRVIEILSTRLVDFEAFKAAIASKVSENDKN